MEEERECQLYLPKTVLEDFLFLLVPLAAHEQMLRGLLGTTAAEGVLSSANVEQVGLVVSMAQLQLIESTGCLSSSAWGNSKPLTNLLVVLGSISGRIGGDCLGGVAAQSLLPLHGG